jgi:hypothetical protein
MDRRPRSLPVATFAGWTVLVWATRVRNVLGDDDLGGGARLPGLALSLSFLLLAGAVLVGLPGRPLVVRPPTTALAAWTGAVWVVRGVDIASGGHRAGFVAVHLALGALSVGLAGWAWRSLPGPAPAGASRPLAGSARRPPAR